MTRFSWHGSVVTVWVLQVPFAECILVYKPFFCCYCFGVCYLALLTTVSMAAAPLAANHCGVVLDVPTIGVGPTVFCTLISIASVHVYI